MGLSAIERAAVTRARSTGSSALAVPLTDDICKYLVAVMVRDLGLSAGFPNLGRDIPDFFSTEAIERPPEVPGDSLGLMDQLVELDRDRVTYFACLAALHGRRLKHNRILHL